MWQISYPPANGAHQGNYLLAKMGVCGFFLQVKFATSLLASLAGDKYISFHFIKDPSLRLIRERIENQL